MAEITDVLEKLLNRSEQGRVHWRGTADPRTYVAVVGEQSVMISQSKPLTLFPHDTPQLVLKVLDKRGEEIDGLQSEATNDTARNQLEQLHRLAKRTALGVEDQLDELLRELDKNLEPS